MKTDNLTSINEMFFNEGLVMFDKDKEIEVFYQTKQLKVKTPRRQLQLVWDKIWAAIKYVK